MPGTLSKYFRSRLIFLLIVACEPVSAAQYLTYRDGLGEYDRGNFSAAFLTFERLAEKGDARSQNALGDMYFIGESVEQNYTAAATWFRRAANQGIAAAQFSLADLHVRGLGVARSEVEAFRWYSLSAIFADDEGHASLALTLRDRIARRLSEPDLADARRRVCDWWRKYRNTPPDAALGACARE